MPESPRHVRARAGLKLVVGDGGQKSFCAWRACCNASSLPFVGVVEPWRLERLVTRFVQVCLQVWVWRESERQRRVACAVFAVTGNRRRHHQVQAPTHLISSAALRPSTPLGYRTRARVGSRTQKRRTTREEPEQDTHTHTPTDAPTRSPPARPASVPAYPTLSPVFHSALGLPPSRPCLSLLACSLHPPSPSHHTHSPQPPTLQCTHHAPAPMLPWPVVVPHTSIFTR